MAIDFLTPQQLAKSTTTHVGDVRSAKSAFQLTTILSYVKQATTTTVGMEAKIDASFWEPVGAALKQLSQDASQLLASITEPEGILRCKYQYFFHVAVDLIFLQHQPSSLPG